MKVVLYHSPCMDGMFSAVAAGRVFGVSAVYRGVNYNDKLDPEEFIGDDIYMLDFSLKFDALMALAERANSVTIIDHHESALKELEAIPKFELHSGARRKALEESERLYGEGIRIACHFDMTQSGAMLSWKYFCTGEVPRLIKHVQDRDLWKFELPGTQPIHEFMMTKMGTWVVQRWSEFLDLFEGDEDYRDRIVTQGHLLLEYQEARINELANKASEGTFMGVPCQYVNAPGYMASDLGNELCSRNSDRIAVIFQVGPEITNISLRSHKTSKFNVSEIASALGGGGHRNAAGCTLETADIPNFHWRAK